jgi:cytochrome b561
MKKPAPTHYDALQIGLHWLVAILITCAFAFAWIFDAMPLSPDKFKMINWHKWTGITVMSLFIIRFGYKLLRGTPVVDPALPALQRKLAISVHHLLYLLMFLLPFVGWLMSSAKGFPVVFWGVLPLPDLIGRNAELGSILSQVHEVLAYSLLALIVLHIAGSVKHYVIDKDGTLARMLPFLAKK